jgi:signal transduction histidine kinase/DNA-binding response OmpR family regulator
MDMGPIRVEDKENLLGFSLFRTLVTCFSLVAVLSCLSIGLLTYRMRATYIRNEQNKLLEALRDEKIAALSNWFEERNGDMAVMVSRPDIVGFCAGHAINAEVFQQKIVTVLETIKATHRSEAVVLADANGQVIAGTEGITYVAGRLPKREAALREAIQKNRMIVSDVLISRVHRKPVFFVFTPIRSPGTNEVIGVLGTLQDPSLCLYPLFVNSQQLGKTGEILLVNTSGLVQSPLKFRDGAISKMTIQAMPARRGAAGQFGILAGDDYRSESVMAAYGYIKEFNWGIVVKRDMDEINTPVSAMARNVVGTSAGVLLVALIFGVVVARQISRPIRRMDAAVRQFASGELAARCPVAGAAEIVALGTAFNEMAATLSSQIEIRRSYAELSELMVAAGSIKAFSSQLLLKLVELSAAHLGAFYLRSENGDAFEQVASVGLSGDAPQSFCAKGYEGELGQAIATGRLSHVRDISAETVFTFRTTGGTAVPREILTLPLLVGRRVEAVISLASLGAFPDTFSQILDLAKIEMGTALSNLLASEKTEHLAEELGKNNAELQAQAVEMEQQTEELRKQAFELQAQQMQLEASNQLKSEFLSNMSHELRTPLNSVLSLSQLMLSNGIGAAGGDDKERIEIIERNGRHLLNLINDILDLSKIEAGRMDLFVSSFSIAEPVNAVVEAMRPLADEKGLPIRVELAEMDDLQTDQDKLRQILLNLMSNANKFTAKGEIGVEARQVDRSLVLSVWDTGVGIPEHALSHIFEEFRQADGSTTRQYGGTGLGLAISRRLAALLGGTIEVESEPGKGSTFTLRLPMCLESQEAIVEQKPADNDRGGQKWQAGTAPPRILLVEDHQVAREQITSLLTAAGFVVSVATNGEEGLAKTRDHVPDGMILDLMMPKVDGFQVLEAIRSTPATKKLPVLILTAKDLTAAERASLSYNNVQQLIQKGSLDRTQLVSAIRRLIGMKELPAKKKTPVEKSTPRMVPRKDGMLSILIVDDHADNLTTTRSLLLAVLHSRPLKIFEARNGKEAVAMAKAECPDLILMDIQMPVMGGKEATQLIKQEKTLRNTVVIALTASAMAGERETILAAGCDDYLSKPVELNTLDAMIRKWSGEWER